MQLEKGQTYKNKYGKILIVDTSEHHTIIQDNIISRTLETPFLIRALIQGGWELQEKPLDQAFKELDEMLSAKPKVCHHYNVRKDYFFSAMVYLTCKDCGKPLN